MNLVRKAAIFAELLHSDHTRKYTHEPYFLHLQEVAQLVEENGGDEEMIAAAYLHDAVEDGKTTLKIVEKHLGGGVAMLVGELTDVSRPNDGNRIVRKMIDRDHTATISTRGKTIKLADIISNVKSIRQHGGSFTPVYLAEKRALLEVLTEGNRALYDRAAELVM